MTTQGTREELITALESAVQETLFYFQGQGQTTRARIDQWGAWEVLAHFPYWHYATAWGINSSAAGGPPWQLSGTADQVNAACLPLHQGESFSQLIGQLQQAQERLIRAARSAQDLEAPAFRSVDGRLVTVGQRLETIARHWRSHLEALKAAGG